MSIHFQTLPTPAYLNKCQCLRIMKKNSNSNKKNKIKTKNTQIISKGDMETIFQTNIKISLFDTARGSIWCLTVNQTVHYNLVTVNITKDKPVVTFVNFCYQIPP